MTGLLRTLELALGLFFASLPRAIVLAVLCFLAQVVLAVGLGATVLRGSPALVFLIVVSVFYAHAWFVLTLTARHLRVTIPDYSDRRAMIRAAIWAAPITLVLLAVPFVLDYFRQPFRTSFSDTVLVDGVLNYSSRVSDFTLFGRQLVLAVWMPVWAIIILSGLPARIMAGPAVHPPSPATFLGSLIAIAPFLLIAAIIGYPTQTCVGECWGIMEGGIVAYPLLGAYFFLLGASCAALSAAARLVQERPASP